MIALDCSKEGLRAVLDVTQRVGSGNIRSPRAILLEALDGLEMHNSTRKPVLPFLDDISFHTLDEG